MHFFSISEGTIGFPLFGAFHLSWLGFFVIFGISFYKTFQEKGKLYFYLPMIPLVLKIIRVTSLLVTNQFYSLEEIPLHLCNISLVIYFIYALTRWEGFKNYIFGVALPAAFVALLFPGFGNLPSFSYYTFESFVTHGILVIYPLYLLKMGEIKPNPRRLPLLLVILILGAFPIHFVNVWLGTNFCYIEAPLEGTPLMLLEPIFRVPYQYGLIILLIGTWIVVYGLYFFIREIKKNASYHRFIKPR